MTAVVNMLLLGIVLLCISLSVISWHSPAWLRWCAMHFIARSEALESARIAHAEGLKEWGRKLGVTTAEVIELRYERDESA